MNEENYEQSYESASIKESPKTSRLFSVEGFILLYIAAMIDILGFLIGLVPVVGWILNIAIVLMATGFFLAYDKFRETSIVRRRKDQIAKIKESRKATKEAKAASSATKGAKAGKFIKIIKWIRPFVEFVPYINAIPLWTISVAIELYYTK